MLEKWKNAPERYTDDKYNERNGVSLFRQESARRETTVVCAIFANNSIERAYLGGYRETVTACTAIINARNKRKSCR